MTEIEECLTCGDTFVQDPHPMNHSFYCDDCGDPREGNESWDDQLAAKIDYQNYLKYSVNGYVYTLSILEEEKHHLASASGYSVDEAVSNIMTKLPEAFEFWGWPSEFPVKD